MRTYRIPALLTAIVAGGLCVASQSNASLANGRDKWNTNTSLTGTRLVPTTAIRHTKLKVHPALLPRNVRKLVHTRGRTEIHHVVKPSAKGAVLKHAVVGTLPYDDALHRLRYFDHDSKGHQNLHFQGKTFTPKDAQKAFLGANGVMLGGFAALPAAEKKKFFESILKIAEANRSFDGIEGLFMTGLVHMQNAKDTALLTRGIEDWNRIGPPQMPGGDLPATFVHMENPSRVLAIDLHKFPRKLAANDASGDTQLADLGQDDASEGRHLERLDRLGRTSWDAPVAFNGANLLGDFGTVGKVSIGGALATAAWAINPSESDCHGDLCKSFQQTSDYCQGFAGATGAVGNPWSQAASVGGGIAAVIDATVARVASWAPPDGAKMEPAPCPDGVTCAPLGDGGNNGAGGAGGANGAGGASGSSDPAETSSDPAPTYNDYPPPGDQNQTPADPGESQDYCGGE